MKYAFIIFSIQVEIKSRAVPILVTCNWSVAMKPEGNIFEERNINPLCRFEMNKPMMKSKTIQSIIHTKVLL